MLKQGRAFLYLALAFVLVFSLPARGSQANSAEQKKYEATKFKEYSEIRNVADQGSAKNFRIKYDISKSFPTDLRELYVSQVKYSSQLIATFFPKKEVMNIYLYTENDSKKITFNEILSRDSEHFADWFSRWKRGEGREHNLGLAASYTQSGSGWQGHAGLIAYSGATATSLRKYAIQVMPHEYFHVAQDYYLNVGRDLNWASTDEYDKFSPPTFREGSANTISFALASTTKSAYLDLYRSFIGEKLRQCEIIFFKDLKSESAVIKNLTIMENRNNREDVFEASYAVGQLLYEWVIANYGFDKYRKIVEN